jgi:putative heme-binding domain-containing protein
MYEGQIAHLQHHDGQIDRTNGRIYRIKAKGAAPLQPFDLANQSSAELLPLLAHPNKWFRRAAIRVLDDRQDATVAAPLRDNIARDEGQLALESLWALSAGRGLSETLALGTLDHPNPQVRAWTIRLLGDNNAISPAVAAKLTALAASEPNVEVRSQLASTARRLPAAECLPIVRGLLARSEDIDEIHLPLQLWWAIESKADTDRGAVLALFEDTWLWDQPLVHKHILSRLMRRWAQAGTRKDLTTCAALLKLSPGDAHGKQLMKGFEEAFQGRRVGNLPAELVDAMSRLGGQSISLGLRRGEPEAVSKALAVIADENAEANERLQLLQILGEARQPQAVPVLLTVVATAADDGLKMAALTSLSAYDSPEIGTVVLREYGKFTDDARSVAQTLLVSRKAWALELLAALDAGSIEPRTIPVDVARKLTAHRDERIVAGVKKHWGQLDGATTDQMREQIVRLQDVVRSGSGSPYAGKKLFANSCAKCHRLFGDGGQIGPDLTPFKRDDVTGMVTNIVNPSAEIREGFETFTAITTDGRVVTGFLVDRDNQVAVLRGVDGQNISLPQDQIEELLREKKSLMPEGQLTAMTEQQVRDLFAYLRSTQPLAD